MDDNILAILTQSDRDEVKLALKNIIIEQIRTDFEESDTYLFDSVTIESMMNEAIDEVKAKVVPLLEERVMKELKLKI